MNDPTNDPIEIEVRFYETDAMAIVHHSNYLRYFEIARVGWLKRKGMDYRNWQARGLNLPVIESQCRYRKPAKFADILQVFVRARHEKLRLVFEYEIRNKQTGEVTTTGETRHVCVDEKMKPIPLPQDLIEVLARRP